MTPEKIVLLGAPGCRKSEVATSLAKKLGYSASLINDNVLPKDVAAGKHADYRVENMIAIQRVFDMQDKQSTVYANTLFDSALYVVNRLNSYDEFGTPSDQDYERWVITLAVVGSYLVDTFEYTGAFFILGGDSDDEALLQDMLESYGVAYIELDPVTDPLQTATECARLLGNGSSDSLS